MPDFNADKKWIQFENHKKQLKAPFVVYADTEAFLKRLNNEEKNQVFSEKCNTNAYQEHKIYSIGYYFKSDIDGVQSYYSSYDKREKEDEEKDCVEWFVSQLKSLAQFLGNKLSVHVPMIKMTQIELEMFNDPNAVCYICDQAFKINDKRVHDHCHFTGRYRGPAHAKCNLNYQESRIIPVVMHNLSGYDAHLFIKKLATYYNGHLSVIPNNSEQYISFTKVVDESTSSKSNKEKIRLQFIDSYRFMPSSLSDLASLIPSCKKRILYSECGGEYTAEQIKMLERKGVFPYDYVDSIERLNETALPSKDEFYNKLNEDSIDDDEYAFACSIWEKFDIKTLRQYSELYLKTDVLLLADIFENFRETCHTIYKLDPAHYITAPGLSWDAMLKYTNVKIELITDIDMLLFVERGIRGGISQCNERHAKANNKYMKDTFNPSEKTSFLMYLDGEFTFSIQLPH